VQITIASLRDGQVEPPFHSPSSGRAGWGFSLLAALADPTRPRFRSATLPEVGEACVACLAALVSALLRTRLRAHHEEEIPVPQISAALRHEVAVANRILGHEGVIDAFGHVSLRHPERPDRYLLSRSRAPALVEPDDILEFTLDSEPVEPPTVQLYAERVIHGEIYKARPDVIAVCHHHSAAIMPFAISGEPIVPVFHLGAAMGPVAPFWDSRDDFGDTNLLVVKPEEGASLARALGEHAIVLMRRHGATVVANSLRELVFRSIYSCDNARYLSEAKRLGNFGPLSPGEIAMAQELYQRPNTHTRAWEYWAMRLAKRGEMPPAPKAKKTAPKAVPKAAAAKKKAAAKPQTSRGRKRR
jgi:ribulose-5-phosphate 4-epimerase/fuculose-1-phosphate aldolase